MCRNPLYLFSLIGALGVGMASGMASMVALIALVFALYYPVVIRREQAYLQGRHGEVFSSYCKSVPSFWPQFSNQVDFFPKEVESNSKVYFNHLVSAVWFPIACGLTHVLCSVQKPEGHWAWFTLP